jgi:hypothetical protein
VRMWLSWQPACASIKLTCACLVTCRTSHHRWVRVAHHSTAFCPTVGCPSSLLGDEMPWASACVAATPVWPEKCSDSSREHCDFVTVGYCVVRADASQCCSAAVPAPSS